VLIGASGYGLNDEAEDSLCRAVLKRGMRVDCSIRSKSKRIRGQKEPPKKGICVRIGGIARF
jgi:hypothetical protein